MGFSLIGRFEVSLGKILNLELLPMAVLSVCECWYEWLSLDEQVASSMAAFFTSV